MSKQPQPTATIVSLFDIKRRKPPPLPIDSDLPAAAMPPAAPVAHVIPDGTPKLVMTIGSGQTGKSTVMRWLGEKATGRTDLTMATLAPNRTLKRFFHGTLHPDGGTSAAGAAFLDQFLQAVADTRRSALLDFGGDDTALPYLLSQGVDVQAILAAGGVELILLYMLSPRPDDLTAVTNLIARGFTPKATALVLNTGVTADPSLPPRPEFDVLRDHPTYQAALARGAAEIWVPRNYAAKTGDDWPLLFHAMTSSPDIGPSDRSRTHHWLRAMDEAFRPIESWLPGLDSI